MSFIIRAKDAEHSDGSWQSMVMVWIPQWLTRAQREDRRFHFVDILQSEQVRPKMLCQLYGISRSTLYYWKKRLAQEGSRGMKARKILGRQRKLTGDQELLHRRYEWHTKDQGWLPALWLQWY